MKKKEKKEMKIKINFTTNKGLMYVIADLAQDLFEKSKEEEIDFIDSESGYTDGSWIEIKCKILKKNLPSRKEKRIAP